MLTPDGYKDCVKKGVTLDLGEFKLRFWGTGYEIIKDNVCHVSVTPFFGFRSLGQTLKRWIKFLTNKHLSELEFFEILMLILLHVIVGILMVGTITFILCASIGLFMEVWEVVKLWI